MKISIILPTVFAATGAFWLTLGDNPQAEFQRRVARSRDRVSVQEKLCEIGRNQSNDFENFRSKQLTLSSLTFTLIFLFLIFSGKNIFISLLLASLLAIVIYILIDRDLTAQVAKHRGLIDAEFPAIIEMYSLAISAGETPLSAMQRIANSASGSIALEFSKVVAAVKSGESFHSALDSMGRQLESVLIRRFVDSLVVATLRGASVIEVLQRHAVEARDFQRNRVLGAAAKAEISMMIPVVFLILPISILFALWPSVTNLNVFAGQ